MADGVLSVDLRLALKKLREDVREASKVIKDGLNKSLGIGDAQVKATRDAGNAQDSLATKTRRATREIDSQLSAWKRLQNFRKPNVFGLPGGPAAPKPDYSGYGPTMNPTQGPMGPGGGLAGSAPYLGGVPPIMPRPPIIPKAPPVPGLPGIPPGDAQMFWRRMLTGGMGAARGSGYGSIIGMNQFMGAFGGTATGGRALSAMGMSGAGGAAAASGGLLIAILALVAALKATQLVIRESIAAAERARQLYSRSLTTGMGLQITAQRGMMAQIIGVGENDIYQYGSALAMLNPRLADAARISASTATTLAPLSYDIRILKFDLEALWATIGADVVPALRFVVNLFDELAKSAVDMYNKFKPLLTAFIGAMVPAGADKQKLMNDLAALTGAMTGPMSGIIARALADSSSRLGAPSSFMKQLPVSNFERMGLVAGMSSNSMVDYTRRTAVATEAIAQHITQLPRGVSRATQPFGINPDVSNP